jgi:3-dehydroquinate synthase
MQTIQVNLNRNSYPVYLGHDIMADPELWKRHLGRGQTLIVSNDVVAPLYLQKLQSALHERDFSGVAGAGVPCCRAPLSAKLHRTL